MTKELEDFCLVYYDKNKTSGKVKFSNSSIELAKEAYDVVVIKGEQHTAKIFDRDLKVTYLFCNP